MSESNGTARLERLEKIVEVIANVQHDMQQDHQVLLRAQIVMTDQLGKFIKETNQRFADLAAAQQRMDDALTALMGTVDEIIRSRRQ
jgi:hypothetical protein